MGFIFDIFVSAVLEKLNRRSPPLFWLVIGFMTVALVGVFVLVFSLTRSAS